MEDLMTSLMNLNDEFSSWIRVATVNDGHTICQLQSGSTEIWCGPDFWALPLNKQLEQAGHEYAHYLTRENCSDLTDDALVDLSEQLQDVSASYLLGKMTACLDSIEQLWYNDGQLKMYTELFNETKKSLSKIVTSSMMKRFDNMLDFYSCGFHNSVFKDFASKISASIGVTVPAYSLDEERLLYHEVF